MRMIPWILAALLSVTATALLFVSPGRLTSERSTDASQSSANTQQLRDQLQHAWPGEKVLLELERLHHEAQKLALEVEMLQRGWPERLIGRYLPVLTAMLAVLGFWFGVLQYYSQRATTERQRVEELRREAAKPFWETQLRLYVDASKAAATIAVTNDEQLRERAQVDFWTLYWGPLACVEDVGTLSASEKRASRVEAAMVAFGRCLTTRRPDRSRDREALEGLSLKLAHAIRDEIGPSFALETAPSSNLRNRRTEGDK